MKSIEIPDLSYKKLDLWISISIFLTFIRPPLAILAIHYIFQDKSFVVSILILSIILIDILDGRIILFSKKVTQELVEFRHKVDVLFDRFIVQSLILSALLSENLALWIYITFTMREVILIFLVLTISKRKIFIHTSMYSRIAALFMGVVFVMSINNITTYIPTLMGLFFILSIIGLLEYYKQINYSKYL